MRSIRAAFPFAVVVGSVACVTLASCTGDDPVLAAGGEGGSSVDGGGGLEGGTTGDASSSCASPKVECTKGAATVCTDTSTDDQNCGKCGVVCGAEATCKAAACACTDTSKTSCSGTCVDTQTNPSHCGGCGKVCPNNRCTKGECDRIVFVTSSQYSGNLGGLAGADAKCQSSAAGKLPGTYQAWVSTNVGPSTRFTTRSSTPYVLPDGTTKVAESFAALSDMGGLLHAIDMTELKATVTANPSVMTNTRPSGELDSASFDCGGWKSNDVMDKFYPGTATATAAATWSTNSGALLTCDVLSYRLYCFQQ